MFIPGADDNSPVVTAAVLSSIHTTSKQLLTGTFLIEPPPYTIINIFVM
jgi:hypothetical protein